MMILFKIELPWSNIKIQEDEEYSLLSLNHIRHPVNKIRLKYKKIEYLKIYLTMLVDQQHQSGHYIQHYLIPFFEKIYALNYEDKPNYLDYKSMFITLY